MLKHDARGGYRGSIPWPGCGRSQRTRIQSAGEPKRQATSTFAAFRQQRHTQKLAPC